MNNKTKYFMLCLFLERENDKKHNMKERQRAERVLRKSKEILFKILVTKLKIKSSTKVVPDRHTHRH